MPRKTIALLLSLFVITALLLAAAFRPNKTTPIQEPTSQEQVTKVAPSAEALLQFTEETLNLTANTAGTASVELDAKNHQVTAIQLELQYDPKVLRNVKVVLGSSFDQLAQIFSQTDDKGGLITVWLGVKPGAQLVQGKGEVAKVTFEKIPGTNAQETNLVILPASLVTEAGVEDSILKTTNSTKIIFN